MHKISEIVDFSIFFKVVFMTTSMSNLYAILYSLVAKILYVTHLYYIDGKCIILAFLVTLASHIT